MTFKKLMALVSAGILCIAVLAGCGGAAGSEEDAIRSVIDNNLKVAQLDKDTLTQSVLGANADAVSDDTKQAVSSMIDELINSYSYTIKDIQVDGSQARATIEVSAKHVSEITADLQSKVLEKLQSMDNPPTDEAGITELAMSVFSDTLKQAEATTQDYDLQLTKGANGWEMDAASQTQLASMFI